MQLESKYRGLPLLKLCPHIHPTLGDTITLKNGNKIGYLEFGDPSGIPIFYFHGSLSSRIEAGIFAEYAAKNGLQLISLDRPSIGLSDPPHQFSFIDWPMAVAETADVLGIERFSVCGTSGGGAFACACGVIEEVARRLDSIILIAGALPATRNEKKHHDIRVRMTFYMAKYMPAICGKLLTNLSQQFSKPLKSGNMEGFKGIDKTTKPGYGYMMANSIESSKLQGHKGNTRDLALYVKPLGFQLKDIKVPVLAFTGLKDRNAPSVIAYRVVNEVANGEVVAYEEADHGTILNYASDMCDKIKAFVTNHVNHSEKVCSRSNRLG